MRLPASLVLVALVGCTEYDFQEDLDTNDTEEPDGPPVADIAVTPDEMPFGAWVTDCPTSPRTITILNEGGAGSVLHVSSVTLADDRMFGATLPEPVDLGAGERVSVPVWFAPTALGDFQTDLVIVSDDVDEPELRVRLDGEGSDAAQVEVTDRWDLDAAQKVDVLWVVDNSCSMADEQASLGQAFQRFVDTFFGLTVDFRIGVTSTDVEHPASFELTGISGTFSAGETVTGATSGASGVVGMYDPVSYEGALSLSTATGDFQVGETLTGANSGAAATVLAAHRGAGRLTGDPRVLSADMDQDDVNAAFRDRTALGTAGSFTEQGLAASQLALNDPLISGENSGFLRDDAYLAVIVLSDEADQSGIDNEDYVTWLDGYKPSADMSSLSGIVGLEGGIDACDGVFSGNTAMRGAHYIEVAEATGGIARDICDLDFSEVVSHLAYTAAGVPPEYLLSEVPVALPTIEVRVNGVEIQYNANAGWSYNQDRNAVVFNGPAIPDPGETVLISYLVEGDDVCD